MIVKHNKKLLGSKYTAPIQIPSEYPIGGVVTHLFLVAWRIPIAVESTNRSISIDFNRAEAERESLA